MTIREEYELLEKSMLSPRAAFAADSRGRAIFEPKCDIRTDFCRDRDRIIHSKSFRRLKQKTQVFISPEGDHFRTRLTHTLEVSQIARTIARAMRLNEDLTEAVALGHDLGHTPFGHAGERALNGIMPNGFRHYEQSVRVVECIEKNHNGLNLTYETIDGIGCHTNITAATLEGNIVRFADRIAYINHDIEDAVTAGVFDESVLPKDISSVLGHGKSERITTLIRSVIGNSVDKIQFDDEVGSAFDELTDYMYKNVYLGGSAAVNEEKKVKGMIELLFAHYVDKPDDMPRFYRETAQTESLERAVCDYISGMSDDYAMREFDKLFIPKPWSFADSGK